MNSIIEFFMQSELALAAYADLSVPVSEYARAYENAGMTATQAQHFAQNWRVVDQYSHPTNGFSATVFEEVSSGKRYLAIRGTDDLVDLVTNAIDVALLPSMSAQYDTLRLTVQNWLGNGKLSPTFTVAGHSLGGYLATGLAAEFSVNVERAYLYNAPGLYGVLGDAIGSLLGAFGLNFPLDAAKISNIKAAAGVSPIAGLGTQVSSPISVQIENQLDLSVTERPAALNHSQRVLTDALAIYSTFALFDQNVSVETVRSILQAISNTNANTLEAAPSRLGKLFGKNYPDTQTTRETLYTNLYDLQAALTTGTVVSLTTTSHDTLVSEAQRTDATGLAYRYALKELNPFAVIGADYSQYNGELALYNPNDGSGNLTDLYLQDRAAFLTWKNKTYTEDTDVGRLYDGGAWRYKDEASGAELWVGNSYDVKSTSALRHLVFGGSGTDALTGGDHGDHLYGNAGNDVLTAGAGEDYLEGQLGNDNLKGEDGRDILLGGQGNDTLDGGKGADRLEGGKGTDVYVLSSSAPANDVIRDMDGLGSIQLDGTPLDGGRWKSAGQWQDATRGITYSFNPDNTGRGNLVITCSAGIITVENFAVGELGLNLPGAPAALPSSPADQIMQGDLAPIDFDPNTAGVQIHLDQLGNVIVDPGIAEGGVDVPVGNLPHMARTGYMGNFASALGWVAAMRKLDRSGIHATSEALKEAA